MNQQLINLFTDRIYAKLSRQAISKPSEWAQTYRMMKSGPFSFRMFPWLREMHDSIAELNICRKGAQLGFTETVLNRTFYAIDIEGTDCLYVLPSKTPDASDFSAARFDPALELSPHLKAMFSEVKNIGHKRAGVVNLYIRGSRARAGLKSVPVGLIVLDEVDEMDQDNIPLALERASGQMSKQVWMVSTPTIEGHGISDYFDSTTMEQFFFKCPHCSRLTNLIFPECLVVIGDDPTDERINESHLICKECRHRLEHRTKPEWLGNGSWVQEKQKAVRGFTISQLYSCQDVVAPPAIAISYLKAQSNPADEQEFYNSKLGLPHVVKGAQLTVKEVQECKGNYTQYTSYSGGFITMGVDVGKVLHYEIDLWQLPSTVGIDINVLSRCKALRVGTVNEFEDLDNLMKLFRVMACVVDTQPERRKALEFANRWYGRVKVCYYARGINGKIIQSHDVDSTISVDRTSWLDLALGRFRTQSIQIPVDAPLEYVEQMTVPAKVYDKDETGNTIASYVKGKGLDHYAHARNYAEIALPLAANVSITQDITGIV